MKLTNLLFILFCFSGSNAQTIDVSRYGAIANSFGDATAAVKKAVAACREKPATKLEFPEGRYDFWPGDAEEHTYYISNTSSEEEYPSKKQRAGLFLKRLQNIVIEGNHSLFVFHGKMISWVLDSCENITLRNVVIDYERPGMSEMTIQEVSAARVVARVHPDSRFTILDGRLLWYGEQWVSRNLHAILADPASGVNVYSSWEPFEKSRAERVGPLTVRFTGDFSAFKAKPGDVLTLRDRYRDYVGAFINRSKNISLSNVHMQFMHGLGIIAQFSENLHYESVFIEPAANSGRVMASSADGMHFSGCKGQIVIDHCRFKGLHDDAINVHGTHLKLAEVLSPVLLKVKFMHPQTYGFAAFASGDSIAFVRAGSLQTLGAGVVKTARLVSKREMLVSLVNPVGSHVKEGDVIENVTWTPALTLTNSRIEGTNTRGVLVTTRRKVLIANNEFYRTGMHAILIADDASDWYESGPVRDVLIRENRFEECAYNSFPNNYIIEVSPQNHTPVPAYWVHENIRVERNIFNVYDYPVLSARSVNGLSFIDNEIHRSSFMKAGDERAALLLNADTKVLIRNNHFGVSAPPVVELLSMKSKDIESDIKYRILQRAQQP